LTRRGPQLSPRAKVFFPSRQLSWAPQAPKGALTFAKQGLPPLGTLGPIVTLFPCTGVCSYCRPLGVPNYLNPQPPSRISGGSLRRQSIAFRDEILWYNVRHILFSRRGSRTYDLMANLHPISWIPSSTGECLRHGFSHGKSAFRRADLSFTLLFPSIFLLLRIF